MAFPIPLLPPVTSTLREDMRRRAFARTRQEGRAARAMAGGARNEWPGPTATARQSNRILHSRPISAFFASNQKKEKRTKRKGEEQGARALGGPLTMQAAMSFSS